MDLDKSTLYVLLIWSMGIPANKFRVQACKTQTLDIN